VPEHVPAPGINFLSLYFSFLSSFAGSPVRAGLAATFHLVDEIAVLIDGFGNIIGRTLAVAEITFPAGYDRIPFSDR
jgi:hypothetical protein